MTLSIVLPVYNVEEYISRCLASITSQNIDRNLYEIIIVIDGSKDGSADICESEKLKFENIKIVYQQNKGLSGARNTGFKNAVGKYVWFVDPDDSIAENQLSKITEFLQVQKPIIYNFSFRMVAQFGSYQDFYINEKMLSSYSKYDYKSLANAEINYKPMIWTYIYDRDFLISNNLAFYEGILHEDEEFSAKALYLAEEVHYTNEIYYNYYQNKSSIMGYFKKRSSFDKFKVVESYQNFIDTHKIDGIYLNFLKHRVFILTLTMLDPSIFLKHSSVEKKEILIKIQQMYFYPLSVSGLSIKHLFYKTLINISPFFYMNLRRIK